MSKIVGIILNIIGASIRFAIGTFWRTISNKNKFTFEQYKNGSIISNEWIDNAKHTHINKIIGFVIISLFVVFLKTLVK